MIKNILLTGSGGFIGKNLKEYFQGKYNLLTPRSYELDLRDRNAVCAYFSQNEIDFIIHCGTTGGARGIPDAPSTVEENLTMVDNLLNAKRSGVRVILFGSGAMYDKSKPICKAKESEIGNSIPNDLYGKSKMLIAQKIKNQKDILCLNIFACYGYGEKETRFPTYAINQALKGKTIEINQNVVFDYLFIEDLEKIIEFFIEHPPETNIINVTPTESISLLEIAQIVTKFSDNPVEIKLKTPSLNNEYTGDNSILLKTYPDLKFTPMQEGLKKLYDYNNKKQPVRI